MKQIARVAAKSFVALILLVNFSGCGAPEDAADQPIGPTGSVSQALYIGPVLKMPLSPGYQWRLNVKAGDLSDWGHQGKSYYSLDFGRHVQDNNGKVITVANPDGSGTPDPNVTIDVLAAAGGKLKSVITDCQQGTTDCSGGIPRGRTACSVEIDHTSAGYTGYVTRYLHFKIGTIPFTKVDEANQIEVKQGQYLGKMGNTGNSCGAHVHFQVLHNGDSSDGNPALEGVTLEWKSFKDYQVTNPFSYYPSTNGFTYRSVQPYGANPRVCKNALLIDPWTLDFTCIQQSTFQTYRPVYSDLRIDDVQKDACYNVEYWRNGQYYTRMSVGCTNGAAGNTWYLPLPAFYTATPGSYEARYFVSTRDRLVFLPAPMAVAKFTVLGQSNQPPPTKVSPAQGAIIHLADSLRWNDAAPYLVTDHDLFFWVWDWNASSWKPFGFVNAWADSSYPVWKAGLPTYRWIGWIVRSCHDQNGCSGWSQFTYFGLLP